MVSGGVPVINQQPVVSQQQDDRDRVKVAGLGWPATGPYDPDGPGPLPRPDGVDFAVQSQANESSAGISGEKSGLGWPTENHP